MVDGLDGSLSEPEAMEYSALRSSSLLRIWGDTSLEAS